MVAGTKGYEGAVKWFIDATKALNFSATSAYFREYLPLSCCNVLDVGAGIGQNAAAIAGLGHTVTVVERMSQFLEAGKDMFPGKSIHWVKDSLPELTQLDDETFDFILINAVWHHLDVEERNESSVRISELLAHGGKCALSLRNGPKGLGLRVFPTNASDTVTSAAICGLKCVKKVVNQPSIMAYKEHVTWSFLVFEKVQSN